MVVMASATGGKRREGVYAEEKSQYNGLKGKAESAVESEHNGARRMLAGLMSPCTQSISCSQARPATSWLAREE